jgi:hypothetical protein
MSAAKRTDSDCFGRSARFPVDRAHGAGGQNLGRFVVCPATRGRRFGVNTVLLLAEERDRRLGGTSAVRACLYVSFLCWKRGDHEGT